MRSPLEQLKDKAIKRLPKPSSNALRIRNSLTQPQCDSLLAMFPYLHGSSHGYGHQGPIRRRLQDKNLIKPKDDGWIPTQLGYEVIHILIEQREQAYNVNAEIRTIISAIIGLIDNKDLKKLSTAVQKSSNRSSAISLVRRLIPGVRYLKDENSPYGGIFLLPKEFKISNYIFVLDEKAKSEGLLTYE